jgi:N-acetylmuramoyl-L-alanine amidase
MKGINIRGAARLARQSARSVAWAAVFLASMNARAEEAQPPVAVAAHLIDDGDSARLSFDLSGPVEALARPIADPDRIIVDFPEVNFQIDPSVGRVAPPRAGALVKAFRFGLFSPGKSRVVIELGRPACPVKVTTKPIAKGAAPSRLTVELKHCDAEVFVASARAANPPAPPPEAATSSTAIGPPVIVIDPGHGGVDGGALGGRGIVEKAIVYDYALELKSRLEASKKFKVVMTRIGDEFVSLGDRVRIARQANAALLISIHADALSEGNASGTTVYTCSDRASDAEAARIAERENAADKAGGADTRKEDAGVADILFDLKRRETRAYAHIFSRGLVAQWQGAGRLNHNPERSAGFVVLKVPDFPSVLVELGYLSNAQDVANMTSADWRTKTATAMVRAIERFFAPAASSPTATGTPAEALATSEKPNPPDPFKGTAAHAP